MLPDAPSPGPAPRRVISLDLLHHAPVAIPRERAAGNLGCDVPRADAVVFAAVRAHQDYSFPLCCQNRLQVLTS
jgi:hypothetical protein